jgi:nicotinamidase-related amidase
MSREMLTPANTTVVLIDYAVGFANVLRSHELATHLNNAVALAKVAVNWETGLVITNGESSKPTGPLYPKLAEVLGDRPVIERRAHYNAFLDPNIKAAIEATGRKKLVLGGVSTEGCVLQSALGALRAGFEVHVVVDACASISRETHDTAVMRMVQAGVVPLTWFSLSGEFLVDQTAPQAAIHQKLMAEHVPEMFFGVAHFKAAQAQALKNAGR